VLLRVSVVVCGVVVCGVIEAKLHTRYQEKYEVSEERIVEGQ